jgi:hypothetical protein
MAISLVKKGVSTGRKLLKKKPSTVAESAAKKKHHHAATVKALTRQQARVAKNAERHNMSVKAYKEKFFDHPSVAKLRELKKQNETVKNKQFKTGGKVNSGETKMQKGKKVGGKKTGIRKKLGMGMAALELPLMAEFYSDVGTGISPRALELMQGLGLMKKGKRVGKGRMSEFDKMVKDLKLSPDEIADMLGLTKMDPKTGVRRKGGKKVGSRRKDSDFEKMVKELTLSPDEVADMLGLTKRDPKTGVRRKAGGTVKLEMGGAPKSTYFKGRSARQLERAKPMKNKISPTRRRKPLMPASPSKTTMTYKKYLAKKNPPTKNMSSGKRVGTPRGCGVAQRGFGKAMKRGK